MADNDSGGVDGASGADKGASASSGRDEGPGRASQGSVDSFSDAMEGKNTSKGADTSDDNDRDGGDKDKGGNAGTSRDAGGKAAAEAKSAEQQAETADADTTDAEVTTDDPEAEQTTQDIEAAVEAEVERTVQEKAAQEKAAQEKAAMSKAAMEQAPEVLKGAGVGLAKTKTATWSFSPSPVTGKVGPDDALQAELKSRGIGIVEDTRPLTGGRTSPGIVSNRVNGQLGEQRLAEEVAKRNPISGIKEQVVYVDGKETARTDRPKGSRVVDVQSKGFAPDIYEQKVGETKLSSSRVATQVAQDADILAKANGIPSTWSRPARIAGKALRPVGAILDGAKLHAAHQADAANGEVFGRHTQKAAAEVGGGWAGALAGAAIGGAAGSGFLGIGAVPGAIIGGIVGAFGGEWFGGTAYDAVAN